MLINSTPLYNSILVYIIFIIILFITKPSIMYDETNTKFRSFGLDKDETLLSFPFVVLGGGVLIYFIFLGLWISSLSEIPT